MIIKGILVLILFLCTLSAITFWKNKQSNFLAELLEKAVFFIFFHAFHVFICELFFPGVRYLDSAAPYGLVYGPLLYLAILGVKKDHLKFDICKIHFVPFLLFFVVYIVLIIDDDFRASYLIYFLRTLYISIPLSFASYGITAAVIKSNKKSKINLIRVKEFFISMFVLLFFISIFFLVVRYTGEKENYSARLIVYSTMFITIINIFLFQLRENQKLKKIHSDLSDTNSISKYTKSKISEEQLDGYEVKLYRLIEEKQLFLDMDLSLDKLAKELKIPSYHLSQLFSLRIGRNFNQFINVYRVKYACSIIDTNNDVKIDQLIFNCGFNSKTSFNRHFKMIVGCSPSEYASRKDNI